MSDIEKSEHLADVKSVDNQSVENNATQYKMYKMRFYGLTLIGLLNIVSSMSWLSVAPVPDYAADYFYGASLSTINWFANTFMLVYVVAGPLSSFVFDRYSIKYGLVLGAGLQTLGSWLRFFSWFVHNASGRLALAIVGQVICAFGQPFILNAATPYAALWFSPDKRGVASMVGGLTNAVGMAIAQLAIPGAVTKPDEMWIGFLLVACITTAFAIPTVFIPKAPKTPPSFSASNMEERRMPVASNIKELITNHQFLIITLIFGVLCGLFSALTSLFAQIVGPYGVSVDDAGYLGVACVVAGIVGAIASGLFIDKTKAHKYVLWSFVPIVGFMYLAFLFVVKVDNYVPMIVICAILGFCTFSLLPVALELSVECTYPVSESFSSPVLWMSSQVLGLVFLVSMDALRDDDGEPSGNMRRALIMATGLSMAMMLFVAFYRSNNKRMVAEAGH